MLSSPLKSCFNESFRDICMISDMLTFNIMSLTVHDLGIYPSFQEKKNDVFIILVKVPFKPFLQ